MLPFSHFRDVHRKFHGKRRQDAKRRELLFKNKKQIHTFFRREVYGLVRMYVAGARVGICGIFPHISAVIKNGYAYNYGFSGGSARNRNARSPRVFLRASPALLFCRYRFLCGKSGILSDVLVSRHDQACLLECQRLAQCAQKRLLGRIRETWRRCLLSARN